MEVLNEWKHSADRKPLVIKGCRQCGKTYSVRQFASANYAHVIYLNFMENDDYGSIFEKSRRIDDIILNISTFIEDAVFIPGQTCIILDEIQECPQARSALKFFKLDGRFDVIATGSLLGVVGYGANKATIPVGYETIVQMFPLDFEEFLWANGIRDEVVDKLQQCLDTLSPVPEAIHRRLRELLLQYTIVGGMPEVVNLFLSTHNINNVIKLQQTIISQYEDDMLKYADDADKSRIRECFESIPKQLAKENKKFQYSLVRKGGKASQYAGSIQWIEDAGIIRRCYNLSITELPLDGNAIADVFKIYMVDTGLFISMLEPGTQADILRGNLYGSKGAIFENLIADIFSKMQRKLYYFRKDSGLEVDFVIRYEGECTLIEVKSSNGNVKSTKTILAHPEKYHINKAIKLCDMNIGVSDQVITLPLYLTFLLRTY